MPAMVYVLTWADCDGIGVWAVTTSEDIAKQWAASDSDCEFYKVELIETPERYLEWLRE